MHESIYNNKITLSTPSGLSNVKVDITRTDSSVEIRLIDTSNIFSLWVYSLSSSDFYLLKREQDILVDYERFIQILANLFHGTATSKYTATFTDGNLRFIENSEFRNICKLELKFSKPEETQYRRYLGDIVSRMESDNIKLIKENAILRERCVSGDLALKEKMKFVESENQELKRKLESIRRDLATYEERNTLKEEEIAKISNRLYSLDNENSQLRYELEKYQRENSSTLKEQLRSREEELEVLTKEMATANDIIKKMRAENSELKTFKNDNTSIIQREKERNEDLSSKIEEAVKKLQSTESKYKKAKEEIKDKNHKIEELSESNKSLTRRLENAQNVYNHFYSKKVDDHPDNLSDTFSLRPESPPPR